jgi:hypothetical protein
MMGNANAWIIEPTSVGGILNALINSDSDNGHSVIIEKDRITVKGIGGLEWVRIVWRPNPHNLDLVSRDVYEGEEEGSNKEEHVLFKTNWDEVLRMFSNFEQQKKFK